MIESVMSTDTDCAAGAVELLKAIAAGDSHAVKSLLQNGADPNERDANGVFPLLLAAFLNRSNVVDLLASHGAIYPRFAWVSDVLEYGKPQNFDCFRRGEHPIVEASKAAILHLNREMFERLLSLPGAERALLRRSALEAWIEAHYSKEAPHAWLGPMCAKVIGTRIDLADHEPALLAKSLTAFYKGLTTQHYDDCDAVPRWETDNFSASRSGVVSLPFGFHSVTTDLDREHISKITTNDDYKIIGHHLEWQPDPHTYVVAAQLQSAPKSYDDDEDNGYVQLSGRLVYSKNREVIRKIANMLTLIRADNVDDLILFVRDDPGAYCGFGSANDVARYAIVHGAERVLGYLVETEKALHFSKALNVLGEAAAKYASFAASYKNNLARLEPDDLYGPEFSSELDYDKAHRVVKIVVRAANTFGATLQLGDYGRVLIERLVEDQPAQHAELMHELFRHITSIPGLMNKVQSWDERIGPMIRAWLAKEAVDRVLQAARPAMAHG
jgi:hypothetical protein